MCVNAFSEHGGSRLERVMDAKRGFAGGSSHQWWIKEVWVRVSLNSLEKKVEERDQ